MEILIDGKSAVLRKNLSFEYVAENRLFSGSDSYSLSISFPLRGCPQNIAIFGNIHRADVVARRVAFDCEIRHGAFSRFGTLALTEISQSEVKGQFLEGRSEQNFTILFDDVFINEMSLGYPSSLSPSSIAPLAAWRGLQFGQECVALPWVNDYSGNIQNEVSIAADGSYSWHAQRTRGLSWQTYLIVLAKRILDALGYTYDFAAWEASKWKFLLVCNTLPWAWRLRDFAPSLPHWTVSEFFAKIELLMECEFDIDHRAKYVAFALSTDVVAALPEVQLDRVVEEHSAEVSAEEPQCEYLEAKNLVYKECDHDMWKYWSCDWYIRGLDQARIMRYDTLQELVNASSWLHTARALGRGTIAERVCYVEECDTYYAVRILRQVASTLPNYSGPMWRCCLQPLNIFGGRMANASKETAEVEVELVPVRVDATDDALGRCMFLPLGAMESDPVDVDATEDGEILQPAPIRWLLAGEPQKAAEYFDRLYVGFWDGSMPVNGKQPFTIVDTPIVTDDFVIVRPHFSLRLNNKHTLANRIVHQVDPSVRYIFKFLCSSLPSPRSVFNICGHRYLCEKLTSTFTTSGPSALVKGSFFRITEQGG